MKSYTVFAQIALMVKAKSKHEAESIAENTPLSEWEGFQIESVA